MMTTSRRVVASVAVLGTALVAALPISGAEARGQRDRTMPALTLTILHNNDGESSLLPTTVDETEYGGIARFIDKVERLRRESRRSFDPGESRKRGDILLNSGDNFLAGTTYQASQEPGAPFYDGIAVDLLRYDALAIGNHEFDFGPTALARFIDTVRDTPFVSANLDVSGEPALAGFAGDRIVSSTVVKERGELIGVVGLTTPSLPTISSPGGVDVLTDLLGIAQAEIDALAASGVDITILISHLQGLDSEVELASQLRGVDVVIGGGGDEVLADPATDVLFPGDADDVVGDYPQVATDADGRQVPIVTTPGNYRYVGQLEVTFDHDGNLLFWDDGDSRIRLVTDRGVERSGRSPRALRRVEQPVAAFVADLAADVVGTSEIDLDCERNEVRGLETNCGNLLTDSVLAVAQAQAAAFGVATPQLAISNGGGMRGEIDQLAGPISAADTFRLRPFGNFVAVAENVPAETIRQIIEEGAIRLPSPGDGGFAHLSGASVVIDTSFPARNADQNTGEQFAPGERVRELSLDDGTVLVTNGVTQDVTVTLAGLNFSLGGGDAYPAVPFTNLGATDQQALQSFIENDLGGVVTAADYPRGGEGRITIL